MTDEEYMLAQKLARLSDAGAILMRIAPDDDVEKERLRKINEELMEFEAEVYEKIKKEKQ